MLCSHKNKYWQRGSSLRRTNLKHQPLLALGFFVITVPCYATDWCSGDTMPNNSVKFGQTQAKGRDQTAYWDFPHGKLPAKVWCFVSDDHSASGQCKGLTIGDGINTECPPLSWVIRKVGASDTGAAKLSMTNQHSSDWRYFSIFVK